MNTFVMAGFGGQGILFLGKVISNTGVIENKEVSWLPSYGPAMRGGTADCAVVISDEHIGSPVIKNPEYLVVLNSPSMNSFEGRVKPGGMLFADSSLIDKKSERDDISCFYIPATQMANDNGLKGLANMIILGKVTKETGFTGRDIILKSLEKSIPASKTHLLESNIKAFDLGYNFT